MGRAPRSRTCSAPARLRVSRPCSNPTSVPQAGGSYLRPRGRGPGLRQCPPPEGTASQEAQAAQAPWQLERPPPPGLLGGCAQCPCCKNLRRVPCWIRPKGAPESSLLPLLAAHQVPQGAAHKATRWLHPGTAPLPWYAEVKLEVEFGGQRNRICCPVCGEGSITACNADLRVLLGQAKDPPRPASCISPGPGAGAASGKRTPLPRPPGYSRRTGDRPAPHHGGQPPPRTDQPRQTSKKQGTNFIVSLQRHKPHFPHFLNKI